MSVTLTIAGTSYTYPSGTDTEWGTNDTNAMVAVAANAIWKDGTVALTANWDAGSFKITAETLESDVATGTAPLVVASTTEVANLKAATATLATTATNVEGTGVLSAGPVAATKFLRADGDGTCSWQTAGSSASVQVLIKGNAYVADGVAWVRVPYAMTAATCRIGISTGNTGAVLTVDVEYHATDPTATATILGTLPSITDSATTYSATSTDFSTSSLAAGGFLKFNIDVVGSTLPGTDLMIEILE